MTVSTREEWLTKRELARKLKTSVRTIERNRYPFTRVGGQNRYLLSQVEQACGGDVGELPDNVVPIRRRSTGDAA